MYFKKIVGEKVYLSPIDANDYPKYTEWLNDYETARNIKLYQHLVTLSNEKEAIEKLANNPHTYAIVEKDTDELLGNISINEIDHMNMTGTLGIFIGKKDNRHKGFGSEAIKLIVDYGFNQLNLNNIMLEVFGDNKNAIKCYEKVGFRLFGTRHEAQYIDGKFIDLMYMEMLKKDFNNNNK